MTIYGVFDYMKVLGCCLISNEAEMSVTMPQTRFRLLHNPEDSPSRVVTGFDLQHAISNQILLPLPLERCHLKKNEYHCHAIYRAQH